jgi:hypothetical protein
MRDAAPRQNGPAASGGRLEKAAGSVAWLVRATSPAGTSLLAGGLLQTIPAIAGMEY